ncbi:hypothetical protein FIA58_009695 [Flavobacterium jejuense]|uniref:Uncharacterized protein n=1 Tax=Flavobacterium jejuense TaxID=1544455 RepID=A0ABX0IV44_9FLAO|nr:hypothetical protein [Flavobacterium jejuense]NHN25946.1 hypothetical protein [Flavobacterium jejuense]
MTIEELKLDMKWWESKRWIFNCLVCFFGSLALYKGLSQCDYSWSISDTIGVLIWGIGANILYSLGILLELFDWYYLKNKIGIRNFRVFLFTVGLLFSCFWTYCSAFLYFIGHIW